MQKHRKVQFGAAFALIAAMAIAAFGTTALARPASTSSTAQVTTKVQNGPAFTASATHFTVTQGTHLHDLKAGAAHDPRALPQLMPEGNKAYQSWQHSNRASAAPQAAQSQGIGLAPKPLSASGVPNVFNQWDGMADSASICGYFGSGCQPPDMGLAAGPQGFAVEAVNTSWAIYNNVGTPQFGPVDAATWLGIPQPTPAGCQTTGTGPFLSDPRAYYDTQDTRFVFAYLEVEGAFGIDPNCDEVTKYIFVVSPRNTPFGTWTEYRITMNGAFGDTTAAADYTQMGFSADGIFFSANMFNKAGSAFDYAETVSCRKSDAYAGVSLHCWWNFNYQTCSSICVLIDTLQPALNPFQADNAAHAEFFVSSFNSPDPFGNNCVTTACHGVTVWAFSNMFGSSGPTRSGRFIDTRGYLEPPGADQPSCPSGGGCIESLDNRVSSNPVYKAGHLYVVHTTGLTNGSSQFVPATQYWDFNVNLATGFPTTINGGSEAADTYIWFDSDFGAMTFPVVMTDQDSDVLLGFDAMADHMFPSIWDGARRSTTAPGGFDAFHQLLAGTVNSADSRWGDFEAMSYTAPYQDFIWYAAQYANPASSGDWITHVFKMKFLLGN